MPVFRIHIDSRTRDTHTLVCQPSFSLSKTICNVRSVRVKHVQVSNTIYNIRLGYNDSIRVSVNNGVTFTTHTYMTPGFYTAEVFVTIVDTFLKSLASDSQVSLDVSNNKLTWTLPTNMVIGGPHLC